MNGATSIKIRPVQVADLLAGEDRMPVIVHVIEHPEATVLVDTGVTRLHPLVADMDPRPRATTPDELDPDAIDIVVNTHLHWDHCGGNHLFAGKPIYVQRRELDDALGRDDYTIREWVQAPGVHYVPVDGDVELLPGVRLLAAPGHTDGSQIVLVEGSDGPVVVVGDLAITSQDLDSPQTPGQQRVRQLRPTLAWLAHQRVPWRPPSPDRDRRGS